MLDPRLAYIPIKDAASQAGRSYSWVRERIISGRIRSIRIGRAYRVSAVDVATEAAASTRVRRRRTKLRLVVDNTK